MTMHGRKPLESPLLVFILVALPLLSASGVAQPVRDSSLTSGRAAAPDTGINGTRLAIVAGVTGGTMAAVEIYQANGWWKDNRAPFHFREDLRYGLWVDKLGHFYAGDLLTYLFSKGLQWANLSERSSLWIGAGTSLFFQAYVEVMDGFHTWGFDRVDFATDVAGSFYPLLQYYVPVLRSFNMKFSYHPSGLLNEPGGIGFRGQQHLIFDDYEGQTIWLGIHVNDLLPSSMEKYWPDWLALAVGYGARNIATSNDYSVVLLSLDYDMTKIIPSSTPFLRTLGEALNFLHFPAPAVQISPRAIWYGIYF
jgi:hypothetical protein